MNFVPEADAIEIAGKQGCRTGTETDISNENRRDRERWISGHADIEQNETRVAAENVDRIIALYPRPLANSTAILPDEIRQRIGTRDRLITPLSFRYRLTSIFPSTNTRRDLLRILSDVSILYLFRVANKRNETVSK